MWSEYWIFTDVLTHLNCTKPHHKDILGVRGAWGGSDVLGWYWCAGAFIDSLCLVDIKVFIVDTGLCQKCWSGLFGNKVWSVFDLHVTVNLDKFLIIKPTTCTYFWNLFLEWNSTCFGQFLCPSSVFHCTHSNGICHTGYADSLRAGSGWNSLRAGSGWNSMEFHPDPTRKLGKEASWFVALHCHLPASPGDIW